MQFTTAVVALFASLAMAQDFTGLPTCAVPCFISAFPDSGCTSTTDNYCLCQSQVYNDEVLACVSSACSSDDQATTLSWAVATCAAAGTTINL